MIILKDRYLSKIETFYVEVKILILAKSEEIGITAEMKKAVFNLFSTLNCCNFVIVS